LLTVRRACIDIGSNTTRLLVADCDGLGMIEVHQERAFTHIRRALGRDGTISPEKIAEVAHVVALQVTRAQALGAEGLHGVATAAVRGTGNGGRLIAAIRESCGLEVITLSQEEEARLAFVGAARTLGHEPAGELGVVDVGGGSSEVVVGTVPDRVCWSTSLALGSGQLADGWLHSDPPTRAELDQARARIGRELSGVRAPQPTEVVAVGGSASSLRRLAGAVLDRDTFTRALEILQGASSAEVARQFSLDRERVRLLPAGLLILQAIAELLGCVICVARGGLREGVLLEAGD
jgi:exopolyphosphatase / guanosine-5'-triphosphate,3'-diphosphate pyrophosphatase